VLQDILSVLGGSGGNAPSHEGIIAGLMRKGVCIVAAIAAEAGFSIVQLRHSLVDGATPQKDGTCVNSTSAQALCNAACVPLGCGEYVRLHSLSLETRWPSQWNRGLLQRHQHRTPSPNNNINQRVCTCQHRDTTHSMPQP